MKLKDIFYGYNLKGAFLTCAVVAVVLTGCSGEKKTETAAKESAPAQASAPVSAPQNAPAIPEGSVPPPGHPVVGEQDRAMHKAAHTGMNGKKEVRLSDAVKAKWNQAHLKVTDASSGKAVQMTVKVGSITPLGSGEYKLELNAIVPDYTIAGDHIETRSNELKNPAILITLLKGDKAVARGWVFRDLAEFNSYSHDRFGIALESAGAKAAK